MQRSAVICNGLGFPAQRESIIALQQGTRVHLQGGRSPEKKRETRCVLRACSRPSMSAGSMTVALMPILGSTVWMNCRVRR